MSVGRDVALLELEEWATAATEAGRISGVVVGGSFATGDQKLEPGDNGSDLDLLVVCRRSENRAIRCEFEEMFGGLKCHPFFVTARRVPGLDRNFGLAVMRHAGICYPRSRSDLLLGLPHWREIPRIECVRLLWNRWSEVLASPSPGQPPEGPVLKVGCAVSLVLMRIAGAFCPDLQGQLRFVGSDRFVEEFGPSQARFFRSVLDPCLRRRISGESGAVPELGQLAEATLNTLRLLSGDADWSDWLRDTRMPRWRRRWVANLMSPRRLRLPLIPMRDPRVLSFSLVLQRVTNGLGERTGERPSLDRALYWWRWEGGA